MYKIIAFLFLLTSFSCKESSDKASSSADTSGIQKTPVVAQDTDLSCEQLVSAIVKSSNAVAFTHFSDTLVQARLDYLTPDKVRIKLYVLSDISDDPATKKLTENAVGWLEFHRQTKRLTDITNDPDKALILQYDTTLLQKQDFFKLCGNTGAMAKPGTGYEQRDVMLEADIRFNGKLKRFFTMAEFEKVFGKPDSIQLLKDETPCVTIFDTEAPDDKYLYKDGSRFETSKNRVAVDEFWFRNGNFITYKEIRIDANTTMNDIKQLFPTAVSERLGMDKEGKLWMIQLKEDKDGVSDGHIKLFFKDGKVNFIHWWFPC
jgi:hypothetical protein